MTASVASMGVCAGRLETLSGKRSRNGYNFMANALDDSVIRMEALHYLMR